MASARKGLPVLYAFGFERVGVVVGDLYFVDPNPREGHEGAEHGVRLELRVLGRGELSKGLTVKAHAFSKTAEQAITSAGGSVEILPPPFGHGRPSARGNALTNR